VRGVGRDVAKERPILVFLDEANRPVKPDVGAIAGVLGRHAVVEIRVVEVVVAPVVRRLADSAATVDQHFMEPLILRPAGVVVAQVPFSKNRGPVAGGREDFGDRHFFRRHDRSPHDRVPHAGAGGIPAGHQGRPRGRAGRVDVVVRQPNALGVESVHDRRLDLCVAVAGQIAVALIVGHDEDHAGMLWRGQDTPVGWHQAKSRHRHE